MSFDLRDYIIVLNDAIQQSLCDQILLEYNGSDDWVESTIASGLDKNVRKCEAINMSNKNIINKNKDKREQIDHELFLCAGKAINYYNEKFKDTKIQGDSGYTLLKYCSGGFYTEHTDHFIHSPRTLSCSFALNDEYDGGEWGFFNREMVLKVPKGSAVMFPSNFMYPHEIMPVTKGVRYSIITWFI